MWQKFGEAGFLGITADEEFGGMSMGYQAHCVVMEEISRASGMRLQMSFCSSKRQLQLPNSVHLPENVAWKCLNIS